MEWSEAIVFIFLMLFSVVLAIAIIGLHIIKKVVNFIFYPIISRPRRK